MAVLTKTKFSQSTFDRLVFADVEEPFGRLHGKVTTPVRGQSRTKNRDGANNWVDVVEQLYLRYAPFCTFS